MIQNPATELRQSCQLGDYLHNNTNKPRDNNIFDAIKNTPEIIVSSTEKQLGG